MVESVHLNPQALQALGQNFLSRMFFWQTFSFPLKMRQVRFFPFHSNKVGELGHVELERAEAAFALTVVENGVP